MKYGGDGGGKMTGKRASGIGPRNGKETKKNIADLRCGFFQQFRTQVVATTVCATERVHAPCCRTNIFLLSLWSAGPCQC